MLSNKIGIKISRANVKGPYPQWTHGRTHWIHPQMVEDTVEEARQLTKLSKVKSRNWAQVHQDTGHIAPYICYIAPTYWSQETGWEIHKGRWVHHKGEERERPQRSVCAPSRPSTLHRPRYAHRNVEDSRQGTLWGGECAVADVILANNHSNPKCNPAYGGTLFLGI